MTSLKGKTVVITGASSGIGKAAAIEFADKGCNVVLAARRADKLAELCEHIHGFNKDCIYVETDVTQERQVAKLFDEAEEKFGKVDILVNSAGRGLHCELDRITNDQWAGVIETNLTSVFLCSREAVGRMKAKRMKGCIVTVSSIAGRFGAPGYSAYCASKHAVTGFCKSIKWELRKYGIKVSTIHPARVDTEFFDTYAKRPGRAQMLSPKDIAQVIVAVAGRSPLKLTALRVRNFFKRIYNLLRYLGK